MRPASIILAKPKDDARDQQPITLDDHNRHVWSEAKALLDARPFVSSKYLALAGKDLRAALKFCVRWHDAGKAHPKWQTACQQDYATLKADPNARARNLMRSGIRHEMASLVFIKQSGEKYTKSDLVAIAAHHKKLAVRHEKRWEDSKEFLLLWKEFSTWSNSFRLNERESYEAAVLKRYLYDGPRAMLQLADGRASAREDGATLPALIAFDYDFPYDEKRGVQRIIEDLWDEPLAILRAPTGAGKTDAALLWAQHQITMGRADRLIIAMPTRFTSNALALGIGKGEGTVEKLSKVGIYHSTSYFNRKKYKQAAGISEDNWTKKENDLARQLETPITVTTLDHLCIALTGAWEDHHSMFWGLAHSCVVIDEADFYDEFTQYNLVTLLKALRVLNVPVLIMSATVPDSALELYRLSKASIAKIYEDKSDLVRPRCRIYYQRKSEFPQDIDDLLQRALDGNTPTIIYANTVKRAQDYCDWFERQGFKTRGTENEGDKNVFVLYHSRFTEPDKSKKEAQLTEMLGKEAWDSNRAYGVAILTQIGELSVNISADFMVSDLCPLDRLAQRAGRLSRFGEQVGELHVVTPLKTAKNGTTSYYPAPYGTFDSHAGWQASQPLLKSQEWLEGDETQEKLSERELNSQSWVDGVNFIYPSLQSPSQLTVSNSDKLEKSMVTNWMIVPRAEAEEDDDGTQDWKSRNVPLQKKVYVLSKNPYIEDEKNELEFRSWREFREWETEAVIPVLAYEVSAAYKAEMLSKATAFIGEEEEILFVVEKSAYSEKTAYSFARGLRLTPEEDQPNEYNPHDED